MIDIDLMGEYKGQNFVNISDGTDDLYRFAGCKIGITTCHRISC